MVSDFLHAIYHNQCYSFKFSIFPSNTVWTIESDAMSLSALQGCSDSLQLGAQLLCNALKFPQLGAYLLRARYTAQQSTELQAIREGMHRSSAARCTTVLHCTKIVQLCGYFTYLSIAHCTVLQCIEPKSTLRHILWFRRQFLLFGCAQFRNQDFMNYNRFFFS